jgi:hypothetical protein
MVPAENSIFAVSLQLVQRFNSRRQSFSWSSRKLSRNSLKSLHLWPFSRILHKISIPTSHQLADRSTARYQHREASKKKRDNLR